MESKLEILTEVLKQMACASAIPYFWGFFFFLKQERNTNKRIDWPLSLLKLVE